MSPSVRFAAPALIGLGAALLGTATGVSAQAGLHGPLSLAERNPLYDIFYVPRGASADPLVNGQTELTVVAGYSNIFERSSTPTHFQLFDLERLSTTVALRRSLTHRVEVGGHLTVHSSWGGFLDPLIEGVHDAFNVSNGDRALEESGQYAVRLRTRQGVELFSIEQRAFAPADLHLFGRFLVAGGPAAASAVSLRTTLKLPTGVGGTNTGGVDFAAELLGRRGQGPWALHWMVGATTLSPPERLEALANSAAVLWGATAERVLNSGLSLLLQAQGSSLYVSGINEDELDDVPLVLGFGVAGSTERWRWHAGFVEDIPPNGPSVDVTVHVQFSRVWE